MFVFETEPRTKKLGTDLVGNEEPEIGPNTLVLVTTFLLWKHFCMQIETLGA